MKLRLCLLSSLFCLALAGYAAAGPAAPSYHVLKRVQVGGEGGWDCLAVDGTAHRLYLSRSTHVMVLNADTLALVGDLPNTPGVHDVALVPRLGRGFTTNGGDNSVTVFDLKSLRETARIAVGTRPDAILFDPATRRVFTFNGGSNDATAVDAASDKVVGTVALGGKPEMAASDEHGTIFVNIEDKSEIVAFDARTLAVKQHWSIAPCEEPSGMAIDRKHHRLFAVGSNGKMAVVDSRSGRVLAAPAIGEGPDGAGFDAGRGLAFSSNGRDGTLTVVKETAAGHFERVASVPTESGARTMALDAGTHRIYLVTAKPIPEPAGEQSGARRRRSYEPGSFAVLVVGTR